MFKKGQSGNPSGRKKGSLNKASGELRFVISTVLTAEMTPARIRNLLKKMQPEQRLNTLLKLSEFILPKLKQTDLKLDFNSMTDKELEIVIQQLFKMDEK